MHGLVSQWALSCVIPGSLLPLVAKGRISRNLSNKFLNSLTYLSSINIGSRCNFAYQLKEFDGILRLLEFPKIGHRCPT